jgi:hypothetical protein
MYIRSHAPAANTSQAHVHYETHHEMYNLHGNYKCNISLGNHLQQLKAEFEFLVTNWVNS